ncbi:MAG: lytic transglycosylase domain-containing protein [Bdellovibrionota bacterium]
MMKVWALVAFSLLSFPGWASYRNLASIPKKIRVEHARELMGKHYEKSVVKKGESRSHLQEKIMKTVEGKLPRGFKALSWSVTQTILKESKRHNFDPYFVMAVISGESSFNPRAVGPVGEIGLMQIRSATGEWMAQKIGMKWKGEKTLRNPVDNIILGTAYLAWLRQKFENNGQLYIAAYNMGAKSVQNAVGRNIRPKDYPKHVMKRYLAFYQEL